MKYTERQLAEAVEALIDLLHDRLPEDEFDREMAVLDAAHPAIDEINSFGAEGPLGLGLGRYGGHAVGD